MVTVGRGYVNGYVDYAEGGGEREDVQGDVKSARVSRGNRARNLGNLDVNRILVGRATFAWPILF